MVLAHEETTLETIIFKPNFSPDEIQQGFDFQRKNSSILGVDRPYDASEDSQLAFCQFLQDGNYTNTAENSCPVLKN